MAWGAIIGAVIGIGGSVASAQTEKKGRKNARAAADIRLKQQGMANAVSRRDAVRGFRVARAQTLAVGASEAGVESSTVVGSASSLGSQITSNLSYFDIQAKLDAKYNEYNKKAGQYMNTAGNYFAIAQNGQAIGQLVQTAYNTLSTPKSTS